MRVLDIIGGTSVDGPGLRTSIYFAGCTHHCPECHNPESWDMMGGTEMTVDDVMARIEEEDFDVTFTGGDPLMQVEQLIELAERVRAAGKKIWCYTGFRYEDIALDERFSRILPYLEVLVDGPFLIACRDVKLLFRGSSNQRLIDVQNSTLGNIVLWHE